MRRVREFLLTAVLLLAVIANSGANAAEQPMAGKLLVATPDMQDPRFVESVIYLVKHDASGTMGLVINKPMTTIPTDKLLESFGEKSHGSKRELLVHYGGPVGSRQGFLLHSDDVVLGDSLKIADGIAMTADRKIIEALARGKGPRQALFVLGYAGWAPGQLDGELKMNTWYVVDADRALIFGADAEKKWRQAVDKRRIPL